MKVKRGTYAPAVDQKLLSNWPKAYGSSRLPNGTEQDQIDVHCGNARGMGTYRLLKKDARAI